MLINVLPENLATEARRLAAEDPEFVYTEQGANSNLAGCSYLGRAPEDTSGRPCIMGQAMKNLGVEWKILLDMEGSGIGDFYEDQYSDAITWLSSVQDAQDTGYSWGRAVEIADEYEGD